MRIENILFGFDDSSLDFVTFKTTSILGEIVLNISFVIG